MWAIRNTYNSILFLSSTLCKIYKPKIYCLFKKILAPMLLHWAKWGGWRGGINGSNWSWFASTIPVKWTFLIFAMWHGLVSTEVLGCKNFDFDSQFNQHLDFRSFNQKNNLIVFGSKKTKRSKPNSRNQLWLPNKLQSWKGIKIEFFS